MQRTLTYFVKGNITVQLTSCLTGLDSAFLLNWNYKQICLFGQILTSQTGGRLYSDTFPYEVSILWLKQSYSCGIIDGADIYNSRRPVANLINNLRS